MRIERAAALLFLLAASGCREEAVPSIGPGRLVRARAGPERSLVALIPDRTPAGEVFARQPNGRAGLTVIGTSLTRGDLVYWGGRRLDTTFGNSRLLTATVPPELLALPGRVEVRVESHVDPALPKLRATFHLLEPQAGTGRAHSVAEHAADQ